jgi:hypothetical protein
MSFKSAFALSLLFGLVSPPAAHADGLLVPFIGANFAGNSGKELSAAIDAERIDWGVSLAYMGLGILGFEADLAYSPDFYGRTDLGGSGVLTATGNLMIGIPIGGQTGVGFRPYAAVGLGAIRSRVDAFGDLLRREETKAAWDFGGGAMFFFGTRVGVRADLRYFHTFGNLDLDLIDGLERPRNLDFARGSVGLILRF